MVATHFGVSRALFGLFSLATAIAWDFPSLVFGGGMTVSAGAALPILDRPDV